MIKKLTVLLTAMFCSSSIIQGQELRRDIDKDSLFSVIINRLPEESQKYYINSYNESTEGIKEFILFMLSMPQSSKEELIENYEKNKTQILYLKEEFNKLVPEGYIVDIEFDPGNAIWNMKESIDLKIYKKENDILKPVYQEWNLDNNSSILEKQIDEIGWNNETIAKIKDFLSKANCISIENGEITVVGFSRSGMGKYFYRIFDSDLTDKEISEYNDGCTYIYYKENVVLEYGGGAVGPQCF